jgi:16S rRNA (cytidine1402-2'-O)-methyltransferase
VSEERDPSFEPLDPGLYIVATPIGNLGDVTRRAVEVLGRCGAVACEDTRVTGKLLKHLGISKPLWRYDDHADEKARARLLEAMREQAVALVSDAGTPLVSDPGFKLVAATRAAGHPVTALPGASATLAALTVAGLPTDRFFFEGFLPPKQSARRTRIAELARIPATLVLFESGPRLGASLADLAGGLGMRDAAVCRELTKLHEEVRTASLPELAQHYTEEAETRGEIVIVIAPPPEEIKAGAGEVDDLLRQAFVRVSVKDAVSEVAAATGLSRRDVYQRALALAKEGADGAR